MRVTRTMNLGMALGWVAFAALAGALLVHQDRSLARERELQKQLRIARALPWAHERMRKFLGDMGIVILGDASHAEVLRVTGDYQVTAVIANSNDTLGAYPTALTGEVLDTPFVRQLAGDLLNVENYRFVDTFDDPEPKFGVRLWRGKESLDILFSLDSRHLDVWTFMRNERGEVVHDKGRLCWSGDPLERLIRETFAKQ